MQIEKPLPYFDAEAVRARSIEEQMRSWRKFNSETFGVEFEEEGFKIPPARDGFGRVLMMAQGITLESILAESRKRFKVEACFNDPNAAIEKNDRDNLDSSYAVMVRHRFVCDDNLLGHSAEENERLGKRGMTLKERLLLGLKVHKETGLHLDPKYVTRCEGTSYVGGEVPTVAWWHKDQTLKIGWSSYSGSKHFIGGREVVEASAS